MTNPFGAGDGNSLRTGGRHDELRKTWQQGQYWETRNDGMEHLPWCPVGNRGYAEPVWDEHQSYRQRPPAEGSITGGNVE